MFRVSTGHSVPEPFGFHLEIYSNSQGGRSGRDLPQRLQAKGATYKFPETGKKVPLDRQTNPLLFISDLDVATPCSLELA